MRAIATNHPAADHDKNFYTSTLAPVNHRGETPFRGLDAALLVVLFLEIAMAMRLFLAN